MDSRYSSVAGRASGTDGRVIDKALLGSEVPVSFRAALAFAVKGRLERTDRFADAVGSKPSFVWKC